MRFFRHVNVRSKAVFSNAMTIIDKIQGWEEEETRVGSQFATCVWICTKKGLTKEQIPTPEMEEYLKKRMLHTNWVCAVTFEDHEWVSESTTSKHVEDMLGMELDYENVIPCVVQWSLLWFSAPTRLNEISEQDLKIESTTKLSTRQLQKQMCDHLEGNTPRVAHLETSGKGPAQNPQKVGSEQRDGRMDDERKS